MLNKLVPTVYAQCENPGQGNTPLKLGDCLRLNNDQAISEVYSNPGFLINLLAQNIFTLGGIILFFMLLYAGFRFIAGGKKGAEDARDVLKSAVIGFIIMFSAYWIVQLVQIITGVDIPIGPSGP